jgi:calcium-dependent protein kinase
MNMSGQIEQTTAGTRLQEQCEDRLKYKRVAFSSRSFVLRKALSFIADYRMGSLIGVGSYGEVYRVECRVSGQVRAMKKILPKNKESSFSEISILKDLDHPNIVRVFDVYEEEGIVYIVYEFGEGGDLFDWIKRECTFSEQTAIQIMRALLSAVTYLHNRGIVHRDIKPENIIIHREAEPGQLKLIDFGASQLFSEEEILKRRIGTVLYMAPEVIRKAYKEKCDVWSCGVILYILLSGRPPFFSQNNQELCDLILSRPVAFRGKAWEFVSGCAKDLLDKLLTKDPAKRISARSALKHDWFRQESERTVPRTTLLNLQVFSAECDLKKMLRSFILSRIDAAKENQRIYGIFSSMDEDGDGLISLDEFHQIMKHESSSPSSPSIELLFRSIDIDKSGYIEFSELILALLSTELIPEEYLGQAFEVLDRNKNGAIDKDELREITGGTVSHEVWECLIEGQHF